MHKKFISALFALYICTALTAHAEVQSCAVGDTEKGNWIMTAVSDDCPIPGPRTAGSGWPEPEPVKMGVHVYRVSGRTKILPSITAIGFKSQPPTSVPRPCITGYAEAYAKAGCKIYQDQCNASGPCRTTYTAYSTICEAHYKDSQAEYKNYAQYREFKIIKYEWKCRPIPEPPKQPDPLKMAGTICSKK